MTTDERPTEDSVEDKAGAAQSGGLNLRADRDVEVTTGRDLIAGDSFVGDKAAGDIIKGDSYSGAQIYYQYYGVPESQVADEAPAPGEPPYKGMQPYTEDDASIFFGREVETAAMVSHLNDHMFLAIAGASGCGKSSLVRAGVIPALKHGHVLADGGVAPDGSDRWPVHIITPTARPLESLAASLTRDNESVTAAFTLASDMAADTRSLNLMARRLVSKTGAERVLIVVDQFEELFTLCDDEAERRAFVDNLINAVDELNGSIVLIIALRIAYVSNCQAHENLYALMQAGKQKELRVMAQDKLRGAIEWAAAADDWEFEEGLVDLLMRDAGFEPAVLPWMSHTLLEIWKRRRGRIMTFSGYAEAGGLRGAIVRKAEAVYVQMGDEEKLLARNIFMRLTELGEGTQDSRRRAPLDEIIPANASPALLVVLRVLAKARLIVVTRDGMHVAHEAIVRDWKLLHQWVEENRSALRVQRRLSQDAANWVKLGRDTGALYRGVKLAQASELAEVHPHELNDVEREFLQTSNDVIAREEAALEEARQQQLETAQQLAEAQRERARQQEALAAQQKKAAERFQANARRLGYLLVATLVLAVAAAVAFGFAYRNREIAEEERRITRARELATTATALIGALPQRSLLLAVEAYGELEDDDPRVAEVEEALRLTLANAGGRSLLGFTEFNDIGSPVTALATDQSGRWIVAGTENGDIFVWNLAQLESAPIMRPHDFSAKVLDIAISPEGDWLYTSIEGNVIYQWDLLNLDFPPVPLASSMSDAYQFSLAVNEQWLVSGGEDGVLQMWAIDDIGNIPQSYQIHDGPIYDLAFSDDGTLLGTGGGDAKAKIFEVADQLIEQPLAEIEMHNEPIFGVTIAPDNRTMVTSGGTPPWIAINSRDAVAFVWDIEDLSAPLAELRGHRGHITSATISPDSKLLATSSWDGTAHIYQLDDLEANPYILRGHEDYVSDILFSADGRMIITGGGDQVVRQWSLESRDGGLVASPIILREHQSILTEVEISMDNKWVATAGKDGLVVLWALDTTDPSLNKYLLTGHAETVHSIAFSPDSRWLVTGGDDAQILLWDLTAADPARNPLPLLAHSSEVTALAFDGDGQTLISGGHDGQIFAWPMAELGSAILLFSQEDGFIHEVAFNNTEGARADAPEWLIASVGSPPELLDLKTEHRLLLWPADELSEGPLVLRGHEDVINTFVVSEDGRWLASGDGSGLIFVWDLDAPRVSRPRRLDDYPDGVRRVALSPNGRWLVAGGWSADLYMWDMLDLSLAPEKLSDHAGWINDVEISQDGNWLVSSSHDKTARLWNLGEIDELVTAQGTDFNSVILAFHQEAVGDVAISPDGNWVVTVSDDQLALLWSLEVDKLLDLACRTAGRNLRDDREEWQRYFGTESYAETCVVSAP